MGNFINPAAVVAQAGLLAGETVADLGCGSGFYVLPAAQLVGPEGMVYAVDVVESKLAATISIVNQYGHKNVRVIRADLTKPLKEIPEASCDLVMLGNILHEIPSRDMLMQNLYRILKTGGRVLAVEWKKTLTPLGPPVEKRMDQQALEVKLMQMGLRKDKDIPVDGYHYAVLFEK